MKKKVKISLILSLAIIFGCFSNVFAATNQNNKVKKIAEVKKSVRVLDNTTDDGVVGTSNLNGTADNSAKVGNQLINPEVGWKRYDDVNNKIVYSGMWTSVNTSTWYKSTSSYVPLTFEGIAKVDFKFYGTKFRIISNSDSSAYASGQQVFIDGINVGSYSQKSFSTPQTLLYESTILTLGMHTVELVAPSYANSYVYRLSLDAVDIDSTGYLVNPLATLATGITLNKTTDSLILNDSIKGTDTLIATVTPDSATNKTVAWKSSDENIVYVDPVTGKITAKGTGTATIAATTTDGSNLSASCVVIVSEASNPTDNSDKAVLNITMTNGQVKQYNVTMDTVNKFISWYRLRSAGSGDPFYQFDITQAPNPSIVKTDYVVFSKISSFEVDDYTK